MMVTVEFKGQGRVQLAVDYTDHLRAKGYLVVSAYDNPEKMAPASRAVFNKLFVDADVYVKAFEE
jgi:hypothetical protein